MRRWIRTALLSAGTAVLGTVLVAPAATAAPARTDDGGPAVFVQTNDPGGNSVRAYHRAADGTLTAAGSYATGGSGGTEAGAPVDALASQGSLTYDPAHRLLLAVNAGSDTLTVFGVSGATLHRLQILPSGGSFPTSVAVHGDVAYVLNAGGDGAVAGFRFTAHGLRRLPGDTRSLRLGNTTPPVFISAPAQVGIGPDGRRLVVTTKNHNTIEVYRLDAAGFIHGDAVSTPSANPVPFAFTFAGTGDLLVTEAGTSSLTDYAIDPDGTLVAQSSTKDGQAALCWLQAAGGFFYGANAGSSSLSAFRVTHDGAVGLATPTGVVAATDAGPIDMTESGGYLYVQNSAAGTVAGYRANPDASLTLVTTVTGLPAFANGGMEGIAAS